MTMPLQFDKAAYLKILRDAGVPPDLAEAHADAIESGLAQPIVLPADLALLKAEILARIDEKLKEFKVEILAEVATMIDVKLAAKLRPVHLMLGGALVMSAISIALNCVILMRL